MQHLHFQHHGTDELCEQPWVVLELVAELELVEPELVAELPESLPEVAQESLSELELPESLPEVAQEAP